jgi:hypothetical protein
MRSFTVLSHRLNNLFYSKRVKDVEPFVADAHRGGRKRFIVRADEKVTAFLELERALIASVMRHSITRSH